MQNSNDPSLAEPYNCRDKDFIWLHNGKRDNLDNIYLHAKTLLEDFYYKLSGASGSKVGLSLLLFSLNVWLSVLGAYWGWFSYYF